MFRRMFVSALTLFVWLGSIAAPTAAAQGRPEGITVRGHWVIDVKNEDGTLASHNEFDNALQEEGKHTLATLLTGGQPVMGWKVNVFSLVSPGAGRSETVFVTAIPSGNNVVLTGSTKFDFAGQVTSVSTLTCSTPTCSPAAEFSNATVAVSHSKMQTIDVTVTISFAAAPHPPAPQ